jgi:hypothetical protein
MAGSGNSLAGVEALNQTMTKQIIQLDHVVHIAIADLQLTL